MEGMKLHGHFNHSLEILSYRDHSFLGCEKKRKLTETQLIRFLTLIAFGLGLSGILSKRLEEDNEMQSMVEQASMVLNPSFREELDVA